MTSDRVAAVEGLKQKTSPNPINPEESASQEKLFFRHPHEPLPRETGAVKRWARYFYDRFVKFHGSPPQIAWGAALGLFVAMSPTMGFQMLLVVPIAALFRISKLAAVAAVWITNPVTAPFVYGINYVVGAKMLGYPLKATFLSDPCWESFWHSSRHVVFSLTLGGVISGLILSVPGYFIVLGMVRAAREKARRLKQRMKG